MVRQLLSVMCILFCKYTKIIKELIFANGEIRKKAKVRGEIQTLTKGEARKKGDLSCELIAD